MRDFHKKRVVIPFPRIPRGRRSKAVTRRERSRNTGARWTQIGAGGRATVVKGNNRASSPVHPVAFPRPWEADPSRARKKFNSVELNESTFT